MQKFLRRYYLFFTAISFVAFFISFVLPFVLSIYLSFTQNVLLSSVDFITVKNYLSLLADENFLNSLILTGKFAAICALSINIISYFLALFIKYALKNSEIFKSLFFIPNLISAIALGYFCQIFLSTLAATIQKFFALEFAIPSFWSLVWTLNWQLIGFITLIYISALGRVSKEVIEAAKVDGASSFKIFFSIKIPSFIPAVFVSLFLVLINSFKFFEQNLALYTLNNSIRSQFVVLNIYNSFYSSSALENIAQAKAVIFFIITAVLFFIFLKALKKRGFNL